MGGGDLPSGTHGDLPLYELLRFLPEIRALLPLREALLEASSSDEAKRWERWRDYETLDTRVINSQRITYVVQAVARVESRTVDNLLRNVGRALEARAKGQSREAIAVLLETATELGEGERFYEAGALLEVALRELSSVGDAALEAEISRQLAKASWRTGHLERAAELYTRAQHLFHQLLNLSSEVVALQGLGNVRAAQGRLMEAESTYRHALERSTEQSDVVRGQLYNQLSQIARRRGALPEANEWQRLAEEVWLLVEAPLDQLVALNNRGLLDLEYGRVADARRALLDGLAIARHDTQRAVLLTNLGEAAVRSGQFEEAEHLAREAEQFAILAGAKDTLIEAYIVLGCAARNRGDGRCVAFFEKALDLAREGGFLVAQARAHAEYGRYRRLIEDEEEAVAHLKKALSIHEQLQDDREREKILKELREQPSHPGS